MSRIIVVIPRDKKTAWDSICGTTWYDVYEDTDADRKLIDSFPSRESAQYWADNIQLEEEETTIVFTDELMSTDDEDTHVDITPEMSDKAETLSSRLNVLNRRFLKK